MASGAGFGMKAVVNFLSHGNSDSPLRTIFRQLALLWKFRLNEISTENEEVLAIPDSPVIIDLDEEAPHYQEKVGRYSRACRSRILLFAHRSIRLQPALRELSGVASIAWVVRRTLSIS